MTGLTHINQAGEARMVDVSAKPLSARTAISSGHIMLSTAAIVAVREGSGPKGDVLATARIAGIMAAKRTAELIPLCHALPLSAVTVDFEFGDDGIVVTVEARTVAQTGVEMEAMTAASIALLTIYDMVKAIDKSPVICDIRLKVKIGGKSGSWQRA